MTTLVYNKKEGVIAVDGRLTIGNKIVDDNYKKYLKHDGSTYFFVGCVADAKRLLEYIDMGLEEVDVDNSWDCHIVLAKNPPQEIYVNPSGFIDRIDMLSPVEALGSGEHFAIAAVDNGKTAKQAVQYAMTRDNCTGGKVSVFDLNKQKFK